MSKLLDRLERISRGDSPPMGFGPVSTARKTEPSMVLLAFVDSPVRRVKSGSGDMTMDGIAISESIAKGKDLNKVASSVNAPFWGIWWANQPWDLLHSMKEAGCDFIIFPLGEIPVEILRDEDLGRILVVESDIGDRALESIAGLPVDLVLLSGQEEDIPYTLNKLAELAYVREVAGRPVFLLRKKSLSVGELEVLRESGVDGIIVQGAKDLIGEMRNNIDILPKRRSKGERSFPTIPQVSRPSDVVERHEGDDEEYEDEDPY